MSKLSTKIVTILGTGAVLLLTALFGLTSTASADCIYQYNANGFNTSSTPVFNKICGAPNGVGDESNFVRIRPDVNGNDEDNTNNPVYSSGTINSSCVSGDKFDVWNYVHNDASQDDNPDVGSGSAAATGTYINMSAPIGSTSDKFSFTGTAGATGNVTNTAGPTSTTNITPAVLDCNGTQVQLSLVPGSVNTYSQPYGQWVNLSQNGAALNTNLPLGSTNAGLPSVGNGTQWGCWTYRIVIVYQVEVTPITQKTPPVCTDITANDQADVKDVSYTANSANVTGFNIDLFNGTNTTGTPAATSGNLGLNGLPFQFDSKDITPGNQYTIVATVLSDLGNVTSKNCQFTFTSPSTPPPTPVVPASTPPSQLVNTGPGSVAAIFAGFAVAGAAAYQWIIRRKLAKN